MKEEVVKKNQILLMDGRNEYEYDEIDESTCPENVHASSTFDTVSSMNHFESNHGNSSSGSPTCDFSSPQKHPNEEAHVGNTFTCLRHDDVYRKIGSIQGAKHHELQQEKEHIKSMTSDSKEASSHLKTPEEKQRHYSLVEMLFSFLSFWFHLFL
ncbi:hypothetical protein C9374_008322 [Naegleria lovaniensis]|uniref:Uncharacterized protein n=1 Tax=Naegleria lovaniensis TaxID=51637 RepID=A0AA88KKU2_NAELO|nr:uncharacterized protein C9374_008322 [Naegleria lovaniensis]KAG2378179.1 hypothetical protein C9374_008322 [Naegleria lovaniensis]